MKKFLFIISLAVVLMTGGMAGASYTEIYSDYQNSLQYTGYSPGDQGWFKIGYGGDFPGAQIASEYTAGNLAMFKTKFAFTTYYNNNIDTFLDFTGQPGGSGTWGQLADYTSRNLDGSYYSGTKTFYLTFDFLNDALYVSDSYDSDWSIDNSKDGVYLGDLHGEAGTYYADWNPASDMSVFADKNEFWIGFGCYTFDKHWVKTRAWTGGGGTPPSVIPEPATLFLFGSGLIGLAGFGRRKLFKKS